MKKLNKQEIEAIAAYIQNEINKATKFESVESITDRVKQTEEYKELSKLKSNSAVRKALELINKPDGLDVMQHKVIQKELIKLGYLKKYLYYIDGKNHYEYVYQYENLIDKIKNDVVLEQLMCDDVHKLIEQITKKYTQ